MPLAKIQRKKRPVSIKEIDEEAGLIPEVVADMVVNEASIWLEEDLSKDYAVLLARKVREFYRLNADFRKRMKRRGNSGRDYLYALNRHWLAALLYDHQYDLVRRLPDGFAMGRAAPKGCHYAGVKIKTAE